MPADTLCHTTGKVSNDSRGAAQQHLQSLRRKHRDYRGNVYYCGGCRGWHVGRDPQLKRRGELSR